MAGRECSGPRRDRVCGELTCPRGGEPDWEVLEDSLDREATWVDACRVCRTDYDLAVDRAVDMRREE